MSKFWPLGRVRGSQNFGIDYRGQMSPKFWHANILAHAGISATQLNIFSVFGPQGRRNAPMGKFGLELTQLDRSTWDLGLQKIKILPNF